MNQMEITLFLTLCVLLLVLVGFLLEKSLKRLLLVVVCVLIYWCGYSLYNIHSAKQQMEQLQGNLQNSLNNLSGNLGENNHGGGGGIVYWTDASGQHGLIADDHDLGEMNWDDAMRACQNKGAGWHLPTKDELDKLYKKKDVVGGFASAYYWSSSEYNSNLARSQGFGSGLQFNDLKVNSYYVRAVRAF